MSGRFFTSPFIIAVTLIAQAELSESQLKMLTVVCVGLGLLSINATLLSNSKYSSRGIERPDGIYDERGIYYSDWGLLAAKKHTFQVFSWQKEASRVSITCGLLGFTGLAQGPSAHLIDNCALADPLLSKLPARDDPEWRIGHFERQLPEGYVESIDKNQNLLVDNKIKQYYDSIRIITRGPLYDMNRLREILKINLGLVQKINAPIDQSLSKHEYVNYALIALK